MQTRLQQLMHSITCILNHMADFLPSRNHHPESCTSQLARDASEILCSRANNDVLCSTKCNDT